MKSDNRPRRPLSGARPIAITSFVSLLAAGMVGCAGSDTTRSYGPSANHSLQQKAGLARVSIPEDQTRGLYTGENYQKEGQVVALPDVWVSEARQSTAELEARRAASEATRVRASADADERLAFADYELQNAFSERDAAAAGADRMRRVHDARIFELEDQVTARQLSHETSHRRNEAMLSASIKEWQSEVERMRSEADATWSQSLAQHEQMLANREAVSDRGRATIEQMTRTADLTEQRAVEKVRELRTQSQTIADQTEATVADLNQQIKTVKQQTDSQTRELRQRADSLRDDSRARVAEMLAEAEALEAQNVEEQYRLALMSAEIDHQNRLAEAEEMRHGADSRAMANQAEIERRRAEAEASLEIARVTYGEAQEWITGRLEQALADVSIRRSKADEAEAKARSAFIKAEIDARVAAVREAAAHDRALAQAEFDKVRAEAFAHARQVESRLRDEIARQMRSGNVTLNKKEEPAEGRPTPQDGTPALTRAGEKPVIVEPERIAEFRTALAEVAKLRIEAEAEEAEAFATRDAELADFNNWWNEKVAVHQAWNKRIDAWARKADSRVEEQRGRATAIVAAAAAEHNRARVNAESGRKETIARIGTLRAGAETARKKAEARVSQLQAQAESTARNGESQVRSLEVRRDSTLRRGTAQSKQLMVEADSLEQSQRAVVAQMREEIRSADRILASELARLDQAANSFVAIAQANYDEAVTMADTFERITIANTTELTAAHLAARKQASADIAYLRNVNQAQQLVADAQVERFVAEADARLGHEEAQDIAKRANIDAMRQIASAVADEERAIADAREYGVIARFNARVTSTESDRNRAYAQTYLDGQQRRANTEKAVAEAAAYRDLSNAALARLNTAASSFQTTAQQNWDSRLAMPVALPTPANEHEVYERAGEVLNRHGVANVPLND